MPDRRTAAPSREGTLLPLGSRPDDPFAAAGSLTARLGVVTTALVGARDPLEVGELLVHAAADALGTPMAVLALMAEDEGSGRPVLEVAACIGFPEELIAPFRRLSLDVAAPATQAARERREVFVESVSAETVTREVPAAAAVREQLTTRATLALPLLAGDELLGVLVADVVPPRAMEAEELDFMRTLAAVGAQALARARSYAEAQEARLEAEAANRRLATAAARDAILVQASAVLGGALEPEEALAQLVRVVVPRAADWCIVHLVDEQGVFDRAARAARPGEHARILEEALGGAMRIRVEDTSTLGHVLATRRRVFVRDVAPEAVDRLFFEPSAREAARRARVRSVAFLPMVARGRAFGVLLAGTVEDRALDDADIALLEELAHRGALAIENAQLLAASHAELDIRTRVEGVLRDAEERYRLLFEAHPRPLWVYDKDTLRFLAVNDAAVAAYGWSRDEFLAMTIRDIRPPEAQARLDDAIRRVHRLSTYSGLHQHRTRDGARLEVEIHSHEITFGGRTARLVLALDVTERERALRDLRASEERFRLVFRATKDVIYDYEIATGAITWSDSYFETFGVPAGGRHPDLDAWGSLVHPEDRDRVNASLEHAIGSGRGSWRELYRYRRSDGEWAHVEDRGVVVRDEAGGAVRMIGAMSDVTERLRLEQQFQQAQKMEAVGQLAGGVAHDFNNMLTAIRGFTDLAIASLPDGTPAKADLAHVRVATDRAAELTRQLLAFSRRQVLQPSVVDVNDSVEELAPMLRRLIGEHVELVLRPSAGLRAITVDPGQLQQVLVNLVVNARDAMPAGGRLLIETYATRFDDRTARRHQGTQAGEHVVVAVSDTGVGMDEGTRSRIFEPFFTTKPVGEGTGLGLAMVYGVVRQSGGAIQVYSEPGIGSTFKLYFPATDEPPTVIAGLASMPSASVHGTETVLVAEDEEVVRRLTVGVLRARGYHVLEAANGEAALALAAGFAGDIHLLVTDVVMPRMGGPVLAARLRELRPALRVLHVSGYAENSALHHGAFEPGTEFLEKPFTPDLLAQRVRRLLDRSPAGNR